MRIVQFMHPGHEYNPHVLVNVGETRTLDWNIGRHARRLLQCAGTYVDAVEAGTPQNAELAFWNEWEARTRATSLNQTAGHQTSQHARYVHRPLPPLGDTPNVQPDEECCFNTDPCVFGRSFKYSLCRQERFTNLQRLNSGDLIVFGATIDGTFYLDTVFVVATRQSYNDNDAAHQVDCSNDYRALTINQLQGRGSLVLYRGVRWNDRAEYDGMFSFTPARRYVTTDERYRCRCSLDFAALNACVQPNVSFNERVQAVSYFDVPDRMNVSQVWREIVRQVIDNGFVLGTSFAWPQQH